ncbi:hypothetical protein QQY66_40415 [Streptomyces sp. DG2A-72]|nr:hypothetical protein [Streptomyces sp. DG2A-72]MDO0937691.1 hypothetical protein [Streptomyces sp. DG2A-72]
MDTEDAMEKATPLRKSLPVTHTTTGIGGGLGGVVGGLLVGPPAEEAGID